MHDPGDLGLQPARHPPQLDHQTRQLGRGQHAQIRRSARRHRLLESGDELLSHELPVIAPNIRSQPTFKEIRENCLRDSDVMVEVRRITDAVEVDAAEALFDDAPRVEATRRFLSEPGHHLLVSYVDTVPVGMVTGVEMTHPDKGTEMFLYELGVAESSRGRGVGRLLVSALVELARERGCCGMWVLTDDDNAAAIAAYRAAGGALGDTARQLGWQFGEP
jgi:ribosomal protein S18 acetylase RimI-like enzyme